MRPIWSHVASPEFSQRAVYLPGNATHGVLTVSVLARALVVLEREIAVRLRNEGRISDEVLRQLEHDLDLREARLMGGVIE